MAAGLVQQLDPPSAPAHNPALRIILAQAYGPDSPLGSVVVDGDASIVEKQAEGVPAPQSVAKGFRQVSLGRDTGELLLGPAMQSLELGSAQLLAYCTADIGRLARDLALNVVELPDTLERLVRDLGFL